MKIYTKLYITQSDMAIKYKDILVNTFLIFIFCVVITINIPHFVEVKGIK